MFTKAPATAERAERTRAVKAWTREALLLPADAVVMATELTCTEPGCPPLETVVAVLREDGAQEQFKIHKALAEVTPDDVRRGAARLRTKDER